MAGKKLPAVSLDIPVLSMAQVSFPSFWDPDFADREIFRLKNALESIRIMDIYARYKMGEALNYVKTHLTVHGEFEKWVEDRGVSKSNAHRFRKIYDTLSEEQAKGLGVFPQNKLLAIASSYSPDEIQKMTPAEFQGAFDTLQAYAEDQRKESAAKEKLIEHRDKKIAKLESTIEKGAKDLEKLQADLDHQKGLRGPHWLRDNLFGVLNILERQKERVKSDISESQAREIARTITVLANRAKAQLDEIGATFRPYADDLDEEAEIKALAELRKKAEKRAVSA